MQPLSPLFARPWIRHAPWWLMMALASATSLASARYLAGGETMIPPPLVPNFIDHPTAFYFHIGAASVALLLGPWQFLGSLRRAQPTLHRVMGMFYVAACFVGGAAAFPIALGSNGGPVAAAGFMTLAALWFVTTSSAVAAILSGNRDAHRRWMIRSFSLTLAGVTLRLYLPIALLGPVSFSPGYAAIAWLCWLPNLLIADRVGDYFAQRAAAS